jgi:hypothetical protein
MPDRLSLFPRKRKKSQEEGIDVALFDKMKTSFESAHGPSDPGMRFTSIGTIPWWAKLSMRFMDGNLEREINGTREIKEIHVPHRFTVLTPKETRSALFAVMENWISQSAMKL